MIVHVCSRLVSGNILRFVNSSKTLKRQNQIKACFRGYISTSVMYEESTAPHNHEPEKCQL